ncbi:hypothetical protein EVAR_3107_1 [Eumeta japonica]|uniref:Uncharacterized protein n=1 Tax=Eumeta variegata TaxID=151549 RepID=A0A4C1XJM2_EUMVA|nr:hypothetical protein EVAR_3107_1 [Eumeta japonica]
MFKNVDRNNNIVNKIKFTHEVSQKLRDEDRQDVAIAALSVEVGMRPEPARRCLCTCRQSRQGVYQNKACPALSRGTRTRAPGVLKLLSIPVTTPSRDDNILLPYPSYPKTSISR